MIDKATFEAHVRAEAERKHPHLNIAADTLKKPGTAAISDAVALDRREAYIAARMEHEWKLVELLQNIGLHAEEIGTPVCNCGGEATLIETLVANTLSPYTKPIER